MLRDLPIPLSAEERQIGVVAPVKVEVEVRVPLTLPWPGPGFAKIIERVREGSNGRYLRAAMDELGADSTFKNADTAWQAVREEIASSSSSTRMKEIELRMLLVSAGKGMFWGAMADFMVRPPQDANDTLFRLPSALLGSLFSIGGDLYTKLRQADLEYQRISEPLERAVEFSCVQHPVVTADQNHNDKQQQSNRTGDSEQ